MYGREVPPVQKVGRLMALILVMEDDAAVRGVLKETLERAGHEVVEACDGREGVELYSS